MFVLFYEKLLLHLSDHQLWVHIFYVSIYSVHISRFIFPQTHEALYREWLNYSTRSYIFKSEYISVFGTYLPEDQNVDTLVTDLSNRVENKNRRYEVIQLNLKHLPKHIYINTYV